jgi:hypothetical protein
VSKLFIFFIFLSVVVGLLTKSLMLGGITFVFGAFIKIMLNMVRQVGGSSV